MIDSHCHLADDAFAADLTEVTSRAAAALTGALCILSADEPDELSRAATVAALWPGVSFAAGVHPHRAARYAGRAGEAAGIAAGAIDRVGAVALGEIGLDYHYDFAPRDVQQDVFRAQVATAALRDLPVIIHTREAIDDTLAAISGSGRVRGVVHCFTGTIDEARKVLDAGLYLSLAGIVTFPKAQALREVAAFVPADRLLIETDAPFLAPVPHRGKRNEPAWVTETFAAVAGVRGVAPLVLADQTSRNFRALVGEPGTPCVR
jgi:TatD DNase family protein